MKRIYKINLFILLGYVLIGQPLFGQQKIDYFPLQQGNQFTYEWSYKENSGTKTYFIGKQKMAGLEFFYFLKDSDLGNKYALVAQEGPGLHCYYQKKGLKTYILLPSSIIASELDYGELNNASLWLDSSPQIGNSRTIVSSDGKSYARFTVEAIETVTVSSGTYKGCLKVSMYKAYYDNYSDPYITTTWFAPGVGKVKWENSRGSKSELQRATIINN
ncbi:MAG: hypothetical protein H8D45_01155 [Bacteroidetes bacterium]|nr:hypothetical protein [Bacteroidota bacterium]